MPPTRKAALPDGAAWTPKPAPKRLAVKACPSWLRVGPEDVPVFRLDISEARKQFNTIDERLKTEPIIFVTRHNKTAFAVVNAEHISAILETFEIMSDPESYRIFQESLRDIQEGLLHDHEDVRNDLG